MCVMVGDIECNLISYGSMQTIKNLLFGEQIILLQLFDEVHELKIAIF